MTAYDQFFLSQSSTTRSVGNGARFASPTKQIPRWTSIIRRKLLHVQGGIGFVSCDFSGGAWRLNVGKRWARVKDEMQRRLNAFIQR